MRPLGLYLHIPFCRSKCLYCDFYSIPHPQKETVERYVAALCRDLEEKRALCREHTVDTVYLGGGTPTLLLPHQLERILETIARTYHLSPDAEVSAECNPATGGRETFARMRRAGFNRLSIGLQSAHRAELRALGRLHDFADFERTWEDARACGFANLGADVMSGIPHQSVESYCQTLERVLALSPEHVSAYGLIIEEGTPFSRMESRLSTPDEECARQMYFAGIRTLESHGLLQYEISNFARSGYESRHNLKYWSCDEYLGFGPAAYSDFGGERFGHIRDAAAYIEGRSLLCDRERPSPHERMQEYVMLRLRLREGICKDAFEERFGVSFKSVFGGATARYVTLSLAAEGEDFFRLTPEGFYVSNAILSELLDFAENDDKKTKNA